MLGEVLTTTGVPEQIYFFKLFSPQSVIRYKVDKNKFSVFPKTFRCDPDGPFNEKHQRVCRLSLSQSQSLQSFTQLSDPEVVRTTSHLQLRESDKRI